MAHPIPSHASLPFPALPVYSSRRIPITFTAFDIDSHQSKQSPSKSGSQIPPINTITIVERRPRPMRKTPVAGLPPLRSSHAEGPRPKRAQQGSRSPPGSVMTFSTSDMITKNKPSPMSAAELMSANFAGAPHDSMRHYNGEEWLSDANEVTDLPTRDHWKPDNSVSCCSLPACNLKFSLLNRRHHCRRCGDIFCSAHSRNKVPLDQNARLNDKGAEERACEPCWEDYQIWRDARQPKRADSAHGSDTARPASIASSSAVTFTPTLRMGAYSPVETRRTSDSDMHPLLQGSKDIPRGD